MSEAVFWILVSMIIYTYFIYPALLGLMAFFLHKPVKKGSITPFVSIIISVFNEEKVIADKVENCLALDYPHDRINIIIGSDGSNDRTNIILNEYVRLKGIIFIAFDKQQGKINVLNELIKLSNSEIVIFTDARQKFDRNAVKELVYNFSDKTIGCVSGELVLRADKDSAIGKGIDLYWEYEKFIRREESLIGSTIGATGAIYAIRRDLFVPAPTDILLDDVYTPMKILEKGYRCVFEPKAIAYDSVVQAAAQESKRKIRTLAGNWQIFFMMKHLFNPFKSKIAWQLFSHKLMRVIIPFLMIAIFILNVFLLEREAYQISFMLQVLFYIFVTIGAYSKRLRIQMSIFIIPYTFFMLNLAAIKGLYYFLQKKQKVTWKD